MNDKFEAQLCVRANELKAALLCRVASSKINALCPGNIS